MDTILQEMKGVVNIADDIINYGSNQQEHDSNFIHPDPERLEALHKLSAPKEYIGPTYFSRNHNLPCPIYQITLDRVKETICKPTTFAYYDTCRKSTT